MAQCCCSSPDGQKGAIDLVNPDVVTQQSIGFSQQDGREESVEPRIPAVAAMQKTEQASPNKNEFTAILQKTAAVPQLGVTVESSNGICLIVHAIDTSGIVCEWNKANVGNEINIGDRVMTVNGWMGDPAEMMNVCRIEQKLVCRIVRAAK